jgi:2-iminobutanoate/2-iminopropanoate deaminase
MKTIASPGAPAAVGPYSHAVQTAGLIFTSGQLGIDPSANKLREGIEAQTRQALNNLKNVLEHGGSGMDKAVKVTIFLTDLKNFGTVNSIYGEYFTKDHPARSCVQVAALPLGGLVEIEAVAEL